jgi:hypothetical protein
VGAAQSDNAIAADTGAIYFYSPELLDGSRGLPNQENLYVYHGGQVQYVASFAPGGYCEGGITGFEEGPCTSGPVGRIQVSPDGAHMAFVTKQQVTGYSNEGFAEMYIWDPVGGDITCVSCNSNGGAPVGGTKASTSELFMANDGRTFFYSPNALVSQDTDNIYDVYEYVDGRPQLISSGTGSHDVRIISNGGTTFREATFLGVSADGVNVFFSTYETLVGQDLNGDFLKVYDARTGGGFPFIPINAPCTAADECHGPGSSTPAPPQLGSTANSGNGGNATPTTRRKHHKKRHQRRSRHRTGNHRHTNSMSGGGR